jgi:hypothetical protein
MSARIRHHIRSNVIGYIAIFLFAVGGTAYATHPGGANTISSGDILNGEVKSGDIGDGEVRAAEVASDSLGSNKIADGSVKNADLSIGASSSNTIADGGVQSVDVKDDTLTGADVAEAGLRISEHLSSAPPEATTCDRIPEIGSFLVSPADTDIGGTTPAKLWVCVRQLGLLGDGAEWQSVALG